jgi:hypothetical protein
MRPEADRCAVAIDGDVPNGEVFQGF